MLIVLGTSFLNTRLCTLYDPTFVVLGISDYVKKRERECKVVGQTGQGCDVLKRQRDCEAVGWSWGKKECAAG